MDPTEALEQCERNSCKISFVSRSKGQEVVMKHTNGIGLRFLRGARWFCFALALGAVPASYAQVEPTTTSKGTVNIALANSNGIVLLTDSMQSFKREGVWHHVQPAQKLFLLDDRTVCSIAGFASETGWVNAELNVEVPGIIAGFKDQLSQHPVPELDAKLNALGFLIGDYIDDVANRHEAAGGLNTSPATYLFEVIAAGYDADGTSKVKKLVLTANVSPAVNGRRFWSHNTSPVEASALNGLRYLFAGIYDVSEQILKTPQRFPQKAAIQRYAQSEKPLRLKEMAALASAMAAQTASQPAFNGFVGGPDQIAILAKGEAINLQQPLFEAPPRPLKFTMMNYVRIQGSQRYFLTLPDKHFLWVHSQFVGVRDLRLDGQFFYDCEIRDSIVEYAGGLTDFGVSNRVINSMLVLGFDQEELRRRFRWSDQPPNTPSLPATIGPAQN